MTLHSNSHVNEIWSVTAFPKSTKPYSKDYLVDQKQVAIRTVEQKKILSLLPANQSLTHLPDQSLKAYAANNFSYFKLVNHKNTNNLRQLKTVSLYFHNFKLVKWLYYCN